MCRTSFTDRCVLPSVALVSSLSVVIFTSPCVPLCGLCCLTLRGPQRYRLVDAHGCLDIYMKDSTGRSSSRCVSHICLATGNVPRAVTVAPPSVTTEALPTTVSSLGQIRGVHSAKGNVDRTGRTGRLNVQRDAVIPQIVQREITQVVVSTWKPLHFTFLIEPPAAPTSRAGPKGPTAAVT